MAKPAKKPAKKPAAKKPAAKKPSASKPAPKSAPKPAAKKPEPKKTPKSAPVPEPKKKKPVAAPVAPVTEKPKKKKKVREATDEEVLDALKGVFPDDFGRKRTLKGIELTPKQVTKFIKKAGATYDKMTVDQKRSINLIDEHVKKFDADQAAAEKAAKTRVSNADAERDAAERQKAVSEALSKARNTSTSAAVLKGANKIINQRLYGLAVSYKRAVNKLKSAMPLALTKLAADNAKTNPYLSKDLDDAAHNSALQFPHESKNKYDVGLPGGTGISAADEVADFDPVNPYTEPKILAGIDDDNEDAPTGDVEQIAVAGLVSRIAKRARRSFNMLALAADDDLDGYDDTPIDEDNSTSDADTAPENADVQNPNGKRGRRTSAPRDKINTLPDIRVTNSDSAFLSADYSFSRGFFNGGKRSAWLGMSFGLIDSVGTGDTRELDEKTGEAVEYENEVTGSINTALPFHQDTGLFTSFLRSLATEMQMTLSTEIVPKHICNVKLANFIKSNGFDKSFALVRSNGDSTGAFGIMLFAGRGMFGGGTKMLMVPFGIVAASAGEITTLCGGDFAGVTDKKLFLFIARSVLSNGIATRGKVFGFSIRERSLMRPVTNTEGGEGRHGKIVKMPTGRIFCLPNIDRRNELSMYRETMQLPETLDDKLIDEADGKTDMERFRGGVVYVDHENNVVFYYSVAGKLLTRIFKGATELNDRDRASLMMPTPEQLGQEYDVTNVAHRTSMSPYGATTNVPIAYFKYADMRMLENLPGTEEARATHGFPGVAFIRNKLTRESLAVVGVTAEDLRTSYNNDRSYYNAVNEVAANMLRTGRKHNASVSNDGGNAYAMFDQNKGLDDIDNDTASNNSLSQLAGRDIAALHILLEIARMPVTDWPKVDVLTTRAEAARVRDPQPEDLEEVMGQFDGLKPRTEGGNDYYEFMPHQAYIERTFAHQRTAALDCDMGGGKTLMSSLDATRWIKTGVDGAPARPCIVMPAALIHNYMKDVKENFFGKNLNFFVLSSATRKWSDMDQNQIKSIGKRAPANTFYVCSYEFLYLMSYQIIVGKEQTFKEISGEVDKNGKKKRVPFTRPIMDTVYPNAQLLLDLGINVIYLDESQKIKNKASKQHQSVQPLSSIPIKRIMTGTMVTRDVEDVFTQASFIDGTMLGTRERFRRDFCDEKQKSEIIRGKEKLVRTTLTASGVMQARRSMWMGLLPAKNERFEFVDLSEEQGIVYEILMRDIDRDDEEMLSEAEAYYGKNSEKVAKLRGYTRTMLTGAKTDDDDSDASKIARIMETKAVSDEDENEDDDDAGKILETSGRDKTNKVEKLITEKKKSIATKSSMLQAFISAPQALKPTVFSEEAQKQLEALNNEMPKTTPKDQLCYEEIEKHWQTLGGRYIPMSKQIEKYGVGSDRLRGKVIIFARDNAIIEHIYAYLKMTSFGKQVGIYIKSGQFRAEREENLDKFKNAEDDSVAIIVAAETSLMYGQNMQSGDLMIKITLPWTTGDYDQTVARIYRNGQKLPCEIVNIMANGTFEVGKLAKFLIRENSNRKIISDYSNDHDLNAALGTLDDNSLRRFQTKNDIENLRYPIYDPDDMEGGRPKKGAKPISFETVDCLGLHDDVYRSELKEAERMAKKFEAAGYGSAGHATIPMASGNPVIEGASDAVKHRDPETNEILEPGPFKYADQMYFDGDNLQRARESGNSRSLTAEIKKAKEAEIAERYGVSAWQLMNERQQKDAIRQKVQEALAAVVEANPEFKDILRPSDLGTGEANAKRVFTNNIVNALYGEKYNLLAGDVDPNWLSDNIDVDDPFPIIAQATNLARLVYNIVCDEFAGTTHMSTAIGVKLDRRGNAVDNTGLNEASDVALLKKNAKVIKSILSGKAQITAPTPKTGTQQAMENEKARQASKKAQQEAEDEDTDSESEDNESEDEDTEPDTDSEDDVMDEDEDVEVEEEEEKPTRKPKPSAKPIRHDTVVTETKTSAPEGLVFGVAELVEVAEGEVRAGRNVPVNDSIYVFVNGNANPAKYVKKLAAVKIGAGRSEAKFGKKEMWVYPVPVTSTANITALAKKIEGAGGFVEKVGNGSKQQYALVAEPSTEAILRVKAPANFSKIENDDMYGMRHHVAEAKTAARTKAVPEVEMGLLMFDRRVFIIALCVDKSLLQRCGFKVMNLLRYDFENDSSIGKRLNLCFKRINEAGIPVVNADVVMKKLKILTKQNVMVYGPKPVAQTSKPASAQGKKRYS